MQDEREAIVCRSIVFEGRRPRFSCKDGALTYIAT